MEKQVPFTALGIDYGRRSIGVACGQSLTGTATELSTLRYDETRRSKAQLHDTLKKIIDEWKPRVIVMGWPLNMDGSESDMCTEVRQFADTLSANTGKKVVYMDERLTSREAKAESGQYSDFRKHPVDAIAARLLLESWFREQNHRDLLELN